MFKKFACLLSLIVILTGPNSASAGQSVIVIAEGYSCMGVDKSRRDTEKEARNEAKRNGMENAITYLKSTTQIKDFKLEKDFIAAYSQGKVTILEEIKEKTGWYRDEAMGDCFRYTAKVEVVPAEDAFLSWKEKTDLLDDPSAPLQVRLWTEKKEYRAGELIKIFIKGNRPFFARILYKDASGNMMQILPNPYRQDNYFQGGIIYELPQENRDRFQLEVTPPFGEEEIIIHASPSPLGDIELEATGSIYQVKTKEKDVGLKSRGLKIVHSPEAKKVGIGAAEFVETKVKLSTKR
ncbi:MAG: DUF4384 domain-containing protein [Syntrophales bacterium]|nr:DUF4384 domain-containing protein [Syntrophales bacterium]